MLSRTTAYIVIAMLMLRLEEGSSTDFSTNPQIAGYGAISSPSETQPLQPKPAAGAKPRTILAHIHHFQVNELILLIAAH